MRDPLENRQLAFVSATPVENEPSEESRLWDLGWFIQLVRDRMTLLSLTVDADDGYRPEDEPFMRAWARASLWEKYAEEHAGVCIAFDRASILDDLLPDLKARGGATAAGQVVYLPRGFADTATSRIDLSQFNTYELPKVAEFVIERWHDLFCVKTLDWNSEHELRVIHSSSEVSDDGYVYVPFRASSIRAVVLGEKFPESRLSTARAVCNRAGVQLLRIEWRAGLPQPVPVG
jgi:hypothetical protein